MRAQYILEPKGGGGGGRESGDGGTSRREGYLLYMVGGRRSSGTWRENTAAREVYTVYTQQTGIYKTDRFTPYNYLTHYNTVFILTHFFSLLTSYTLA